MEIFAMCLVFSYIYHKAFFFAVCSNLFFYGHLYSEALNLINLILYLINSAVNLMFFYYDYKVYSA